MISPTGLQLLWPDFEIRLWLGLALHLAGEAVPKQ